MNNKSYLFIGISALIHLSVFGIISQQINETLPVEHGRSAINVEITQSKKTVSDQPRNKPESKAKKQVAATGTNETLNSPVPVIKHTATVSKNKLNVLKPINTEEKKVVNTSSLPQQLPDSPSIINDAVEDAANEINTEQVIAVLQQELSKYFYYPKSAQRKNWEGLVILSFIIMPDGVIHKIKVSQSSGYDILDTAAVEALTEVKSRYSLVLALNGNSLEQHLPVTYKLTN